MPCPGQQPQTTQHHGMPLQKPSSLLKVKAVRALQCWIKKETVNRRSSIILHTQVAKAAAIQQALSRLIAHPEK